MNRKIVLVLGILVVLVAVVAFALKQSPDPESAAQPPPEKPAAAKPATSGGEVSTPAAESKGKPRDPGAWAKLSEKYGGTRTNLSKKVTTDIADVLDESVALADMGAQMGGSKTAAEAAGKQMVRAMASQLNMTEEQQAKATELVQAAMGQRMSAVNELATAMRDDPGSMMEMLLAGDAVTRGEMTQAEYDETTGTTRQMLQNVAGFVVGRNPNGIGNGLFGDEQFNNQLAAILTPEQQQLLSDYAKKMAEQAGQPGRINLPLQNGTIPMMELEKLEQTIASAKQMAGGFRQLMEGMKTLQQNLPQQPPKPESGTPANP